MHGEGNRREDAVRLEMSTASTIHTLVSSPFGLRAKREVATDILRAAFFFERGFDRWWGESKGGQSPIEESPRLHQIMPSCPQACAIRGRFRFLANDAPIR